MAHYDDQTVRDLAAQAEKLLPQISQEDDDTYYRAREAIETLGAMPDLDHLPPNRRIGPRGEGGSVESALKRRDEMAALLDALVDQHEEHESLVAETVPIDHGEVREIRDIGTPDARGNHFVEITYQDNHVERVMRDREQFERAEATMRLRTDEAQDLRDMGHEIGQLGEVLAHVHDSAAAAPLRERRDALQKEVRERKRALTNAIVEDLRTQGLSEVEIAHSVREQWGGRDGWGLSYEAREPGVPEALALARDGKITEMYDALPESPAARMQLRKFLDEDPALKDVPEQLLQEESRRRDEVQEKLRVGGVLG